MKATEITRRYHDAWKGRDADGLVATFTKEGTFCNPDTYPGVSGEALAAYAKGLWTAFPTFTSSCSMLVKLSQEWSLIIGECKAPIPAKEPTVVNLPDAP